MALDTFVQGGREIIFGEGRAVTTYRGAIGVALTLNDRTISQHLTANAAFATRAAAQIEVESLGRRSYEQPTEFPTCELRKANCSATLSSDTRVMTAHHCLFPLPEAFDYDACSVWVMFESTYAGARQGIVLPPSARGVDQHYPSNVWVSAIDQFASHEILDETSPGENPLLANRLKQLGLDGWAQDEFLDPLEFPACGDPQQANYCYELQKRPLQLRNWLRLWPATVDVEDVPFTEIGGMPAPWTPHMSVEQLGDTTHVYGPDITHLTTCRHSDTDIDGVSMFGSSPEDPGFIDSGPFPLTKPAAFFDKIIFAPASSPYVPVAIDQSTPVRMLHSVEWPHAPGDTTPSDPRFENLVHMENKIFRTPLVSWPGRFYNGPLIVPATGNDYEVQRWNACPLISQNPLVYRNAVTYQRNFAASVDGKTGSSGGAALFETSPAQPFLFARGVTSAAAYVPWNPPYNDVWRWPPVSSEFADEDNWVAFANVDEAAAAWSNRDPYGPDPFNPAPLRPSTAAPPTCTVFDPQTDTCLSYLHEIEDSGSFGAFPADAELRTGSLEHDDPAQGFATDYGDEPREYELFSCERPWDEDLSAGLLAGVLGAATLLDDREALVGSLHALCTPWSTAPFTENWRQIQYVGRRSYQMTLDVLLSLAHRDTGNLSAMLPMLFEKRCTDEECGLQHLRPASMQFCPPNYFVTELHALYDDEGRLAGVERLVCTQAYANGETRALTRWLDPANHPQPSRFDDFRLHLDQRHHPFSLRQRIGVSGEVAGRSLAARPISCGLVNGRPTALGGLGLRFDSASNIVGLWPACTDMPLVVP